MYDRHTGFAERTLNGLRERSAELGVRLLCRPYEGGYAATLARVCDERPGTTAFVVQSEAATDPLPASYVSGAAQCRRTCWWRSAPTRSPRTPPYRSAYVSRAAHRAPSRGGAGSSTSRSGVDCTSRDPAGLRSAARRGRLEAWSVACGRRCGSWAPP